MKELIAKDNADYQDKAFYIATNADYLNKLKYRLNQNKLNSSLFDSKKFTKNIEKIYINLVKNL